MDFRFGFSYIGLLFLLLLMIPNLLWSKHQPKDYDPSHENKFLQVLERVGEVSVTCLALFSADLKPSPSLGSLLPLLGAGLLMLLYEGYWLRYFRSQQTLADFYSSFCGIPLAGATLPVGACLLLSICARSIYLLIATILLGIGHIGIHIEHKKELHTTKP